MEHLVRFGAQLAPGYSKRRFGYGRARCKTLGIGDCGVQAAPAAVLETAGSPEAKQLLGEWAKGADGAMLTEEAKGALTRLSGR